MRNVVPALVIVAAALLVLNASSGVALARFRALTEFAWTTRTPAANALGAPATASGPEPHHEKGVTP
jgi:hypothetical protein